MQNQSRRRGVNIAWRQLQPGLYDRRRNGVAGIRRNDHLVPRREILEPEKDERERRFSGRDEKCVPDAEIFPDL